MLVIQFICSSEFHFQQNCSVDKTIDSCVICVFFEIKKHFRGAQEARVALGYPLTLYTLMSVCIFSLLLFIYFLTYWKGEFASQSRASLVGDHFLYTLDFKQWFWGDILRRNLMLVKGLIKICLLSRVINPPWSLDLIRLL